jgi:cytochrome c oxidase cbb3-type subunit IV
MDYETVATVTQVGAMLFFIALFIGVLVYVFWPGNKKRFEKDAQIPLQKARDHRPRMGRHHRGE